MNGNHKAGNFLNKPIILNTAQVNKTKLVKRYNDAPPKLIPYSLDQKSSDHEKWNMVNQYFQPQAGTVINKQSRNVPQDVSLKDNLKNLMGGGNRNNSFITNEKGIRDGDYGATISTIEDNYPQSPINLSVTLK